LWGGRKDRLVYRCYIPNDDWREVEVDVDDMMGSIDVDGSEDVEFEVDEEDSEVEDESCRMNCEE